TPDDGRHLGAEYTTGLVDLGDGVVDRLDHRRAEERQVTGFGKYVTQLQRLGAVTVLGGSAVVVLRLTVAGVAVTGGGQQGHGRKWNKPLLRGALHEFPPIRLGRDRRTRRIHHGAGVAHRA